MKHWKKSRTLNFNAIAAILSAAELSFGLLKPHLGEATYGVLLFVVIVGNAYLRTITTQPVARRKAVERAVQ